MIDEIEVSAGGRRPDASRRATTTSARAAMWGLSRTLVANMVQGVTAGLRADAGAGRRRLSRGDEGPGALHAARLLPRRRYPAAGRHHLRRAPADRNQRSAASTSSWSARPPPASARSARRSPTRARACATPARRSAARKARRSSRHGAFQPQIRPSAAPQRVRLRLKKLGAGRPRLSVFRSSKNIYAQVIDDAARRDAGARLDARGEDAKRAPTRTPPPGSARWSPSAPSTRASRTSCSTAAAIIYHGRVKALADAAREAGLNF